MTGWNLPPGCNVSDIPGNRPGDDADEALYGQIYDILEKHPPEKIDTIAEDILRLCSDVYAQGYQEGMNDEAYATQLKQRIDAEGAIE